MTIVAIISLGSRSRPVTALSARIDRQLRLLLLALSDPLPRQRFFIAIVILLRHHYSSSNFTILHYHQKECKSPMTHAAGNPHLVYVRRKPEVELGTPSTAPQPHNPSPAVASLNLGNKAGGQDDGANQKEFDLLESRVPTPQASSILSPPSSSLGFSYAKSPSGMSGNCLSPPNLLHLHANPTLISPITVNAMHWEGRISQLNNLLKKLDRSDQKDYIEMLRSLSSVELSKHAVELEKRSIQLSLDEAKELQRVQVLDVLERYTKHSRTPSTNQNVSEK